LAYQKESLQWWCDFDKTVLANEQVEAGKCWRCGNVVGKKSLKQWFFKITDYADRLVEDLDKLDWSEAIKSMQRNWIGKSEGAEIDFKLEDSEEAIKVFTTRPDTIYGATFMVLAPEHPLVEQVTSEDHKHHITTYVKATQAKSDVERQETDREKTGVFTGAYAINPLSGQKIPVWIADYVLYGYGTGAIMAVPAHDERDFEFAQKFNIEVVPVISPSFGDYEYEAIDRPTVNVVAHDPITDKYCMLKWHDMLDVHSKLGLEWPGGALDAGETIEEAALREFTEETGYHEAEVKSVVPSMVSTFWKHEKVNDGKTTRSVKFIVKLETKSLSQKEVGKDDYEKDSYDVLWLTKDEVLSSDLLGSERQIADFVFTHSVYSGDGVLVNSSEYNNLSNKEAKGKIIEDLEKKDVGKAVVNYKIRDWLISRQRYWGAPIPVIHCEKDGAVPVPDDQLPVELPKLDSYAPNGEGTSVLAGVSDWVNVECPKCGGPAKRETDTMDGFACSSWYFLRFADPHNDKEPFSKDKAKFWLPVDDYIGGAEHAVMHLLYARMWTKVMFDEGLIEFNEPFTKLRNHGMILAPDGRKMSKSWGNTITPDEIIDQGYGADAIRVMELFIGPWDQSANWSVEGMGGCFRFLQRVWVLVQEYNEAQAGDKESSTDLMTAIHKATKKVTGDLETMGFNTAIAALMELVNELYRIKAEDNYSSRNDWKEALQTLVKLLAPFAPHISEELWSQLGNTESVHISAWPKWDEKYLVVNTVTIAIQVNGKLRGEVEVAADASQEDMIEAAKKVPKVAGYLEGHEIRKSIAVPGKLVSFVI